MTRANWIEAWAAKMRAENARKPRPGKRHEPRNLIVMIDEPDDRPETPVKRFYMARYGPFRRPDPPPAPTGRFSGAIRVGSFKGHTWRFSR